MLESVMVTPRRRVAQLGDALLFGQTVNGEERFFLFFSIQRDGAPGRTRTCGILLRSQLTTLIRTCRSERKARENQQLVINGDKLLTPFSSPLSSRFAAICHN